LESWALRDGNLPPLPQEQRSPAFSTNKLTVQLYFPL